MNILAMLWGRTAGIIVGAIGLVAALLRIRYSIRKGAKDEMSAEIQKRTIEQIATARRIEGGPDRDRDGVLDELRKQGHLRE
jgi:hypothetical protein